MTVALRCPNCGEREDFYVRIDTLARLIRDSRSPDGLAISIADKQRGDYNWGAYHCGCCAHEGPRETFAAPPGDRAQPATDPDALEAAARDLLASCEPPTSKPQ